MDYLVKPDELYALNQEGIVPDDELDPLYTTTVTWALRHEGL